MPANFGSRSALNLLVAFAVALKHRLRFEPYTNYEDLARLVGHLDTLAGAATAEDPSKHTVKPGKLKSFGQLLGLSFATSNPRKAVKKAQRPIGNLPLEILSYLGAYTDELIANGQLPIASQQTLACRSPWSHPSCERSDSLVDNNIAVLNDVLVGTERVLNTPLPIAYAITIAQITWVYVFLLPFQLFALLSWVTIPATMAAAYIILGILFIGREIENPFGHDVNDLPLESFCAQIATELDIMASRPKPTISAWVEKEENRVLFPLSNSGYPVWLQRSEEQVRAALIAKTELGYESKKAAEPEKKAASPETV